MLYIDHDDFRLQDSKAYFRLAPGKTVGLFGAPHPITCVSHKTDPTTGEIVELTCRLEDGSSGSTAPKPKAYIQWVDAATGVPVTARIYNSLFKTESPNTLDWKTGGWADDLNPNSEVIYKNAFIEKGIRNLISETSLDLSGSSDALVRFQALRTAYFCVDIDSTENDIVLNQIVSLREDKGK